MEQPNASPQLILPTDKRNPSFTIYQTEDGRSFHVYYGVERLETIPACGSSRPPDVAGHEDWPFMNLEEPQIPACARHRDFPS